jgi:transcription elongation factor GreA
MVEKVPMTAGGYAALEVELKERQSVHRPRIIEQIAEARSHGDLSENAEYHAAKEEQSHNEGRISDIEDKLARADIIDISSKGASVEVVAPGGAKAYEITKVEWR